MFKFDENGKLILPDKIVKENQKKQHRLEKGKCVLIKKEQVSHTSPKKCVLHLKLSEAITDNQFVENVYKAFNDNASTPLKLIKINEKEFDLEIGTSFRRCSECIKLIGRFRGFLYDNVIEERGSCTYESTFRKTNFCYEDYFD